jgi:hypothetical protein
MKRAQPIHVTLCFCTFCQRATGSTHMVEPIFRRSDFAVVTGATSVFALQSSGSGKRVDVHFCATCGTKIFLGFERFPDVVGVYAGTFDNPNWFERPAEITACLFLDNAQDGAIIPAGVATYRQHRLSLDGSRPVATIYDAPFTITRGG